MFHTFTVDVASNLLLESNLNDRFVSSPFFPGIVAIFSVYINAPVVRLTLSFMPASVLNGPLSLALSTRLSLSSSVVTDELVVEYVLKSPLSAANSSISLAKLTAFVSFFSIYWFTASSSTAYSLASSLELTGTKRSLPGTISTAL